jgi:type IV pilus assembly protein PilM
MGKLIIIGLDIGHYAIKAVLIKVTASHCTLVDYAQLAVTDNIFSDNYTVNYPAIVKKLQALKRKLSWRYRYFSLKAVLSLPDNAIVHHTVSVKAYQQGRELELAIQEAFSSVSPFSLQELYLDFVPTADDSAQTGADKPIGTLGIDSGEETAVGEQMDLDMSYQVYATRKSLLDSRVAALTKADYVPLLCEPESHSLFHIWSLAQKQTNSMQSPVLLHIGLTTSAICIAPEGHPPFYKLLMLGTQTLGLDQTQVAADGLGTDNQRWPDHDGRQRQACKKTSDKKQAIGKEHVRDFFLQLANKLEGQLQIHASINPDVSINKCWLSGGVTHLDDVVQVASSQLSIPCELLDIPRLLQDAELHCMPNVKPLALRGYEHSIGLALNGIRWQREHDV